MISRNTDSMAMDEPSPSSPSSVSPSNARRYGELPPLGEAQERGLLALPKAPLPKGGQCSLHRQRGLPQSQCDHWDSSLGEGANLPPSLRELRPRTAGGRLSEAAISAAVGKHEEKRKPEVFSGHCKAEVSSAFSRKADNGGRLFSFGLDRLRKVLAT